jgi:hypothetical protein
VLNPPAEAKPWWTTSASAVQHPQVVDPQVKVGALSNSGMNSQYEANARVTSS